MLSGKTMDLGEDKNIFKIIDETGLLSELDSMTIKELRENLRERGFGDLYGILTSSLLLFGFLTGKGMVLLKDTEEDKKLKEIKFAHKYNLTKDELLTLKMMADGLTNQEIADELGVISVDGVARRIMNIKEKLEVNTKIEAVVKAAREGLI